VLLIVGHGPSVLSGLGAVIDTHTVVRLKDGLRVKPKPDPFHFGSRTDYLCARSKICDHGEFPYWHFNDPEKWVTYYRQYSRRKPSTGLCAVFCAIDNLNPPEIALIGFDRVLTDDMKCGKWYDERRYHLWGHDQKAERECLFSLRVPIIDFAKEFGGKAS
jgi:hypothetical protein